MSPPSAIQRRVSLSHLLRLLPRRSNLHQLSLADPGTPLAGFLPFPPLFHQLGPERK